MANPPIHRLATELLSHIFSFCPSSFDDFCESPSETDDENGAVALRVSHVSRHWHAVSHATPSLWRTITVISPRVGEYDDYLEKRGYHLSDILKPHVERVEHYLWLSGKLPLRIVLYHLPSSSVSWDPYIGITRDITSLIFTLTGEIHRWESFYAYLPVEYFKKRYIFASNVPMPLLTELRLEVDELGSGSYAVFLPTETPKLERLTIYRLKPRDTEDTPRFSPNSALRYISVSGIEFDEVAPIINAASADMAVELVDIKSNASLRLEEPITCSSHTLSISAPGDSELAKVLVPLTLASSVKTLEFCWVSPFPLGSFKGMLSRSPSTEITNFTLRYSRISDTHLLNLLAALPCLTHLTIEEHLEAQPPPFSYAFFDVLADSKHDNDSMTDIYVPLLYWHRQGWWLDHFGETKPFDVSLCPLLPRLTNLVLVFRLSSITENTVKMIKSRVRPTSEGIARLQFVSLHYHGDLLNDESHLGLKNLSETEGLELDVRQLDPDSVGKDK